LTCKEFVNISKHKHFKYSTWAIDSLHEAKRQKTDQEESISAGDEASQTSDAEAIPDTSPIR
jgi:hypothetical protein